MWQWTLVERKSGEHWMVALTEITMDEPIHKRLYIDINFLEDTYLNGFGRRLLRHTEGKSREIYKDRIYIHCQPGFQSFGTWYFSVKNSEYEPQSVRQLNMVLHFKRYYPQSSD